MLPRLRYLLNTPVIEIWPAHLLRARGNVQARILSAARQVLRRKRDGLNLAAQSASGLIPLLRHWQREPGMAAALEALAPSWRNTRRVLPMDSFNMHLVRLGLDAADYAERTGLVPQPEPARLELAGFDRYHRPLWLVADAAAAWALMRTAARVDGIALDAISGYRSHDWQMGVFRRKLELGLTVREILAVNAAPGFSEHHSGAALDIGTPGWPPVEESFEHTPAFIWLCAHAGRFGFSLSYPRGNPHGIVYEPWHWRYHATVPESVINRAGQIGV